MKKNRYYLMVTADGRTIHHGLMGAPNAEIANEMAFRCADSLIHFDEHPGVKFNIVVSERPIPRGGRVEIRHGREFMVIPVECEHGKSETVIPLPDEITNPG
jgi:hypothetical protein